MSLPELPSAARQALRGLREPVGVFDSGVGGLTVLAALRASLPNTDFIYVADTARVPYGRKPPEMVRGFAAEITRFLVASGVRGVVVACNTASAAALPDLWESATVPVWGVIDPGVEAARRCTKSGRVGVLGTVGTIRSGVYQRKLEALGLEVWAQACPMFVHLVEEGLADSPEAEILARHYLAAMPAIDTLVLGCTHYPVLRPVIQRAAGEGVRLVSSADVTAERLAHTFNGRESSAGRVVHFVTGDIAAYRHTAAFLGGLEGEVEHLDVNELAAFAR